MSLAKLSLARNILIILYQGQFDKLHPGWGQENRYPFFYSVDEWGPDRYVSLVELGFVQ
jgi:hypothetical protein